MVGYKLSIKKTKVMASAITSWQIEGEKVEAVADFILLGSKVTAWKESYDISRQHVKKQRHYFADKSPYSQSYSSCSSHVWM